MFELEKGVPVPKGRRGAKYPIPEMEVGDSFFIPTKDRAESARFRNSINGVCRYAKVGSSKEFTLRAVEGGLRCWRIK